MILDLCHTWGRDPSWFYTQPRGEQVRLLGWWRSRVPKGPEAQPSRRGPRPSPAAEAVARQVAQRRRELREGVHADPRGEAFWFNGGG